MNSKTIISLTAISCVSGLSAYALFLNIDGVLFSVVVAAICGLAGYRLKESKLEEVFKKTKKTEPPQ